MHFSINFLLVLSLTACGAPGNGIIPMDSADSLHFVDSINHVKDGTVVSKVDTIQPAPIAPPTHFKRTDIVDFAKTLLGTTYKYACSDPSQGFDCSGFVYYVFGHFNIKVPRSSIDFTNAGEDVALNQSKPGDLILFRGTDPRKSVVGHIGIIVANDHGDITFIQSTSGEAYSVIVSPLDKNYMARFVKVIRMAK